MILTSFLALTPLAVPVDPPVRAADLFVIKARRVELGDGEVMEHAVILVEDGVIVTMGQDLPVERGIPVIELEDHQVVLPGLVNPYSRYGMTGSGFNDSRPYVKASDELYPTPMYDAFLENGVTTVAQYPAGQGIPGQAVALKPLATKPSEMIVEDGVYLKAIMRNSSSAKRALRQGFEKVDEYDEKVAKEREKWEKKNKSKKDDKDDDKKSSSKDDDFTPPEPEPEVKAFMDLREGRLRALFSIGDAASYAHLVHAIGDEEFEWHLRIPLTRDIDVFHVKDEIGEKGCYTLMEPLITLMPGTMRQRNLPAEFDRAGAKLVLIPRDDSPEGFAVFLEDVGTMIAAGLDRASAIRAITSHPAQFLGLGDRVGTLAEGRRANLVVFSGDPFQPGTEIDGVMLDGRFVTGDIDQ